MSEHIKDTYQKKFSEQNLKTMSKNNFEKGLKYMSYLQKLYYYFLGLIKAFKNDSKAPSSAKEIRITIKNDFYIFSHDQVMKYKFSCQNAAEQIIPYIHDCWQLVSDSIDDKFFDKRYQESIRGIFT